MNMSTIIVCLVIWFALGAAFFITTYLVKKSNDIGYTKAKFEDFTSYKLDIIKSANKISKKEIR